MKIGDRVITTHSGGRYHLGWEGSSRFMHANVEAIITKLQNDFVNDGYNDTVQVRTDDGAYYVRCARYLKIVELHYEIY